MEHIGILVNISSLNIVRESVTEEQMKLNPHIVEIVNKLFIFFYSVCRGFDKQYQDPKRLNLEKTQWIKAFTDINFDKLEKVKRGIKTCRLESPINTPTIGQFIKWCAPTTEDLGLLTKEKAYKRAIEMNSQFADLPKDLSEEQLAIIKHAIKETGSYELRELPKDKSQPIFERNYEIACKDFMAGKLQAIPKALVDQRAKQYEQIKRSGIGKGFEHCTSYELAMIEIRKMTGIKTINGRS